MADMVGRSELTLKEVIEDFIKIVPNPILAGGFAMAHHGFVRATVDVDVIAFSNAQNQISAFKGRGYKHESVQLPIGHVDMLTKGNKGVDFLHLNDGEFVESIEARAVIGLLLNHQVRFVSLEDLIILKTLALKGRTRKLDEADLEFLTTLKYDSAYVESWKRKFGVRK